MRLKGAYILILGGVLLASCSVTRRMPDGELLLVRNRIAVEPEQGLARPEQVARDDLSPYIRQRPNKRIFGIPFFLQLYNLSRPEKENWTKRIGEAPVIYAPAQTRQSVDALSIYLRERGFLHSSVRAVTDTLKRRKAAVEYRIRQGTPSRIGTVAYDFQDRFIEPIVLQDSAKTLIRTGDVFNTGTLQAERRRITEGLKALGYYNFSINNIIFPIDTLSNPGLVGVKTRVRQRIAGYEGNDPVMENNKVYRIRNIYIRTDYDPDRAVRDSGYLNRLDTMEYRGVYILYRRRPNIRPDVLMRAVNIYPNDLYDADNVNRAYDNLMRLNYFRSAGILFTELPDSLGGAITFIGGDAADADNSTQEGFLDCTIQCTPGPGQSYSVDFEAATTSTYYGALTTLGYQNRNLLRGAESIDFSVTFGYEFMRAAGRKNSIELGGAAGITFPRFVAPFRIDPYNRLKNVSTRAELSVNYQDRPYYTRSLTSANWGYNWSNSGSGSFIVRPLDISVVKARNVDSVFIKSLKNEYLTRSFDNQLIAGVSGSYIYNNQAKNPGGDAFRLRLNAETNGNLLSLVAPLFVDKTDGEYYKFFGIRYAQYVRADLDMSYTLATGRKTAVAARFYVGAGHTYGNSRNSSIPFERQFYAGGPNSMRGWQARTLGPGSRLSDEYQSDGNGEPLSTSYPSRVGNFKLETNLEFRFPVYRVLNGAVFADLGNIWVTGSRSLDPDPDAYFKLNRFYDQLGLNTGLGARFNFGFMLFRADWGIRLHDPNRLCGEKWIRNLTLRRTAFSFSVGYPF